MAHLGIQTHKLIYFHSFASCNHNGRLPIEPQPNTSHVVITIEYQITLDHIQHVVLAVRHELDNRLEVGSELEPALDSGDKDDE